MKTSRNCSFSGGRGNYFRLLTVVFSVALASAALTAGAVTLPKYTQFVEYIESSGTQWINTGFSPTNKNVRIEVTYRFVSLPTGTNRKYIFGESYNDGKIRLQYAVGSAGHCGIGFGNTFKGDATFDSYDTNTTHTIVCNGGVFSLDGVTSDDWDLSAAPLDTTDTNHPIYLFGHNVNNGNPSSYLSSIRLYSCKVWDQGELVRDFMPVSLTNGTVVCLYDAVGEIFYYNAGSGNFTAGKDVTAYRNAAYIESDKTALINTGYAPTSKTEIEIQFSFTQLLEDKRYVFGVYGDNGGRFMFSYGPASTGCFLGYGNTHTNSVAGIPYNTAKHVMKYVRNEGFVFDGTVVDAGSVDLTKWAGTSKSLYLGALNPNGGSANVDYLPPIRIYYCKLWENGALVRDWVPVQRKFDGKIGLYDKVTGNLDGYYGNRTDFTAHFSSGLLVILR